MVTDEMVEKAARCIEPDAFAILDGGDQWRIINSHHKREATRTKARAALDAALSAAEPVGEVAGQQCRYWMTDEGRWSNWFDITFNTWVPEPGVREVRNLYAALPAPSVAVKALEWKPTHEEIEHASFMGVVYYARHDGRWGHTLELKQRQSGSTMESAKAAAQADYEGRIRSALSAQVQDVAGWEAIAKAAQDYVDAVSGEPEKDCWDTEDGKEAPGADKFASDWAWKEYDDAKQKAFDNLRAMLAAAPAKQEGGHE